MKTKALIMLLLLTFCLALMASENLSEAEEQWQKTQELNRMADRFKRETGFKGRIEYGYERMRLGSFEGNFTDIPFSPDADTLAFRQACERIIDKILPYSSAKRSQLSQGKISSQWGRTTTDYRQQVNGYRVEGSGFIMITYEAGRKYFSIGDNTVELPDGDVGAIITTKEAELIAIEKMNSVKYQHAKVLRTEYSITSSSYYYLAHIVVVSDNDLPVFGDYIIVVNAQTGTVMSKSKIHIMPTTVDVTVSGLNYPTSPYWSQPAVGAALNIENAKVSVSNMSMQTDAHGNAVLHDTEDQDKNVALTNDHFRVCIPQDMENEVSTLISEDNSNHVYSFTLSDSIGQHTYYLPNAHSEALEHMKNLGKYEANYYSGLPHLRIVGFPVDIDTSEVFGVTWGGYSSNNTIIVLRDSRLNDVIRHELSHHFIHSLLGVGGFDIDTLHVNCAMDEACATYFGGSPTNSNIVPNFSYRHNLNVLNSIPTTVYLTENSYSLINAYIPLASAWWSLRGNSLFPNDNQGVNGVDTLLVAGLEIVRRDIEDNAAYRYKPRYFYNILMSRTATDTINWVPNPKQEAINKAYSDRGFHFYPKVKSISQKGFARDKFNMGDTLRIEISEAPQNTPFKVYVVKHGEYQYTDGNPMPLQSIMPSGFTIVNGRTDTIGNNTLNIWSIPANINGLSGAYDIIVDFGSPAEADGVLRFAFKADNVLDGIDGRINPGFIIPQALDLVLALD